MRITHLSSEFLSFGRKVTKVSVIDNIRVIFNDVKRIKEQWYKNDSPDETYQVRFILDQSGSWFAVWIDDSGSFYRYEGVLLTKAGKRRVQENFVKLNTDQILQILKLPSPDDMYTAILAHKTADTH